MNVPWARAAAWFGEWPRRGVDLDAFVDHEGPLPKMQGSHLCHQAYCILPSHVCYEPDTNNYKRNTCKALAKHFRRYSMEIPIYCKYHDPPCLLQVSIEPRSLSLFTILTTITTARRQNRHRGSTDTILHSARSQEPTSSTSSTPTSRP